MKHKLLLTALITTTLALPVLAAEDPAHGHAKDARDHPAKVAVVIPETPEALWTAIEASSKKLGDLVTAKKAEGAHEASETLKALVSTVAAKYPALSDESRKRIEGMARSVATSLDKVHHEAEEGHWDDVAKKLAQIDGGIKIIKAQVTK